MSSRMMALSRFMATPPAHAYGARLRARTARSDGIQRRERGVQLDAQRFGNDQQLPCAVTPISRTARCTPCRRLAAHRVSC